MALHFKAFNPLIFIAALLGLGVLFIGFFTTGDDHPPLLSRLNNFHALTGDVADSGGALTILTLAPSGVATTSAILNGDVSSVGPTAPTTRGFVYGKTTSYEMGTTAEAGTFDTPGSFSTTTADFVCGNTYHYAAYVTVGGINTTGADQTFTTNACPVRYFASCPAQTNLYTEMTNQFTTRIAGVTVPADATTNPLRDTAYLKTWVNRPADPGNNIPEPLYHYANSAWRPSVTLISPRHIITAKHLDWLLIPGTDIYFEGVSHQQYIRKIVEFKQAGNTDIAIILLDSDLPSDVPFFPIVTMNELKQHGPMVFPVVYIDQHGDYLIRKMTVSDTYGSAGLIAYDSGSPFYSYGLETNDLINADHPVPTLIPNVYASDSGNPGLLLINNIFAFGSKQFSAGGGEYVGAYVPEINQAMSDVDKKVPDIAHGYQATTLDLSCYAHYAQASVDAQSFNVSQYAPVGTVVGTVQVNPGDSGASTTSFYIASGNTYGTTAPTFSINQDGTITIGDSSALTNSTVTLSVNTVMALPGSTGDILYVPGTVTIHILNDGQYLGPDTVPPVVTSFTIPATANTLTIPITSFVATDDRGVTGYYVSRLAGSPPAAHPSWLAVATTTYTFPDIGTYTLHAWAKDAAGNKSLPVTATVTISADQGGGQQGGPDTTPPVISAITVLGVTTTGATIQWTTNESADSQVKYDVTPQYGQQTAVNTNLSTAHSVQLSGLSANTLYHYQIWTKDSSSNFATSSDTTFATPVASTVADQGNGGGGGGGGGGGVYVPPTVIIPTAQVAATSTLLVTTTKVLMVDAAKASGAPLVPSTFRFTKLLSLNTTGNDVVYLQNILYTKNYLATTSFTKGVLDPSTSRAVGAFQIANKITTTNDPGYGQVGPKTRDALNKLVPAIVSPATTAPSVGGTSFVRTLSLGSSGADVKALQVFLNTHGYKVATAGTGSPGHESTYFGAATKAALIKFQNANKASVLVPVGLSAGTGIFGEKTREVVGKMK